jgi:predicted metal-dependent hydrolase
VRRAQTIPPRNHWALLLCRVMSAKSKSGLPRGAPRKKMQAQPKPLPANFSETKSHGSEEELFARGIELFNTRYFFEAHEAWEEIWLHTAPPEKTFLQGLIQMTAAFHHHSRENLRGTKSLLRAGLLKLEDFPPHHRGLNIEKLREAARRWLAALDRAETNSWPALPRIAPAPRSL